MGDTVKLIIEISKEDLKRISDGEWIGTYTYDNMILNGTPLDDVKAEIKAMFPPSGNWMYDENCEHEHTACEVLVDVLQILDNIGKESEVKPNE